MRCLRRTLRVGAPSADLEGRATITTTHLGEAFRYRRALGAAGA